MGASGRWARPGAWPAAPAAHGPVRYARPPDLYEIVCALSPIELWYHVHFVPMQEADLCLAPDKLTTLKCSEMEWTSC